VPAYEWDKNYKAFVKTCACCNIDFIGVDSEQESIPIFKKHFDLSVKNADGFQGSCKDCCRDHNRKHVGMEKHDRRKLLKAQNGCCAICNKELHLRKDKQNTAYSDHDRNTGRVRGLLCDRCNRGLGFFDENPDTLYKASIYLGSKA
jgi:hypothetical protein